MLDKLIPKLPDYAITYWEIFIGICFVLAALIQGAPPTTYWLLLFGFGLITFGLRCRADSRGKSTEQIPNKGTDPSRKSHANYDRRDSERRTSGTRGWEDLGKDCPAAVHGPLSWPGSWCCFSAGRAGKKFKSKTRALPRASSFQSSYSDGEKNSRTLVITLIPLHPD